MKKNSKYTDISFNGKLHTVECRLPDGRTAQGTAKTNGAARKNAREAALALPVSVASLVETPAPAPVPVASAVPQIPASFFEQLSAFLASQGKQIVDTPVASPQTPAPVSAPVSGDLKDFSDDPVGYAKARRDSHNATKKGFNGTGKNLKSSVYKTWVDEGMISRGFKPVYRGRTQEQIHELNKFQYRTMKAVSQAAKNAA